MSISIGLVTRFVITKEVSKMNVIRYTPAKAFPQSWPEVQLGEEISRSFRSTTHSPYMTTVKV
jgi:hypothetical protein